MIEYKRKAIMRRWEAKMAPWAIALDLRLSESQVAKVIHESGVMWVTIENRNRRRTLEA